MLYKTLYLSVMTLHHLDKCTSKCSPLEVYKGLIKYWRTFILYGTCMFLAMLPYNKIAWFWPVYTEICTLWMFQVSHSPLTWITWRVHGAHISMYTDRKKTMANAGEEKNRFITSKLYYHHCSDLWVEWTVNQSKQCQNHPEPVCSLLVVFPDLSQIFLVPAHRLQVFHWL